MIALKLFVTSHSKISRQAVESLRAFLENRCPEGYTLDIIDVLDHPERAQADNILATPTLIKYVPAPEKKIIGDLSAYRDLEQMLDINCSAESDEHP